MVDDGDAGRSYRYYLVGAGEPVLVVYRDGLTRGAMRYDGKSRTLVHASTYLGRIARDEDVAEITAEAFADACRAANVH